MGSQGFTLLELLVVVAIVALASGFAVVALRPSSERLVDQDAQRVIAALEAGRALSRASSKNAVRTASLSAATGKSRLSITRWR